MLRFLFWRLLAAVAFIAGVLVVGWFLGGGPGAALRGEAHRSALQLSARTLSRAPRDLWHATPTLARWPVWLALGLAVGAVAVLAAMRLRARAARRYVRLAVELYRTDRASAEALVNLYAALHKRLSRRWWRRLLQGQPSVALEIHHRGAPGPGGGGQCRSSVHTAAPHSVWFAVACPEGLERMIEAALRGAYPNCRLVPASESIGSPPAVLRLKKHGPFILRAKTLDRFEQERDPPVHRLLTVMGACPPPAFVQLALTPAPALFEGLAKLMFKHREATLSRERRSHNSARDRSIVEDRELRGGLELQHRPLFYADLRVIANERSVCEQIASELRVESAENRLVERGTVIRHGVFGMYGRRVRRGEGNPVPSLRTGVFAANELASIWQLPSGDYVTVPLARSAVPLAPAPPGVFRPSEGEGCLRDALGAVSIDPALRKQNTAVPGTVEQGKTSFLVASVADDLRRDRCAVIVLDPKGDAAEAAISLVPPERTCTLLDFAKPTCGFNPLAVEAPADVIADYVVAALKNLFTDADIRASSDRYLRNSIIAVLAYDPQASLWDAARLLSVGEEGYAYWRAVAARVRTLPEFKEIASFFTDELTAQLADARSTTTAKLDAPVNKLARLLNSPSIKRVLLNDSLRVDFDSVIARCEVLVVKGALGGMGAGNTSVLMQLLVGMLDAALARQQDLISSERRVAVALKIDEAPLVLNRGFAETMALKRSAGLETVACWQTDSQWIDKDVRGQLDGLFAHRVYFATASVSDARAAASLTMTEFSDTVRPGISHLATLGHPDVRLHLPKHHAIVSVTTASGRQPAFLAQTIPLARDPSRLALHARRQRERGGYHLADLRQSHWARPIEAPAGSETASDTGAAEERSDVPASRRASGEPASVERDGVAPALPGNDAEPEVRGPAVRESGAPADSYSELVELDRAHTVRWAKAQPALHAHEPDALDISILTVIARLRHVLSTQIHRHFNPGRASTTTQRRLKRLADTGLVERLQFHRRDGGGVPMCYLITLAGLRLLDGDPRHPPENCAPIAGRGVSEAERARQLRLARHDVHVAGWVLALERAAGGGCTLRGSAESVLVPPTRAGADGRARLAPTDLRLPGARVPHDFLRTSPSGGRVEADGFETIRPDATLETGTVDVLLELDDRLPIGRAAAKLERYDHFLAGWSLHTQRYGRRAEATALVVFVCRDRARARELTRRADALLCACRAYPGEYPFDWEYPGRERMLFAAERDVHEGSLAAYGVPRLPPAARVSAAHGDPSAAEAGTHLRAIVQADRSPRA